MTTKDKLQSDIEKNAAAMEEFIPLAVDILMKIANAVREGDTVTATAQAINFHTRADLICLLVQGATMSHAAIKQLDSHLN